MDKLATTGTGGFPFVLDDIRWFLGRTIAGNQGIYVALNHLLRGYGDNFIVQGVVASGTTPNVAITEGWIMLAGELIKVNAQTGINTATDNKFVKATTFDTAGDKTFRNGASISTYEVNRASVTGTTGPLRFDDNNFSDLRSVTDKAGVETPIKTKTFDIGDWDMNATGFVSISHGLATDVFKLIRKVNVIIRDDGDGIYTPLEIFNSATGDIDGGVGSITDTVIVLFRRTGGVFDSTVYDTFPAFNRGFITLDFED